MESVVLNKSRREVRDPEAAAFLTQPGSARYIEPFLGQECSLKDAAETLQISMSGLFYWLERMLALGLVEITRIEQRRGRPIKHYRATAEEFFVPFRMTRAGTYEEMLREQERPQHDRLLQGIARVRETQEQQWGILLSREDTGAIRYHFTTLHRQDDDLFMSDASRPALFSGWITAHMSHAQARLFQQRMMDILQEVSVLGESGEGEAYVLHVGIAPHPD
ncbi:hypothetical protein [Deinococcus cellulosilyticus]|nr:hypothetical protein [Deinococcus cellulosilyticus]